jgi:tetratricopeptide (TPR) repeat protein
MARQAILGFALLFLVVPGCKKKPAPPPGPPAAALAAGDLRKAGTVRFETSCKAEVQGEFEHAVALLHSFFYDESRRRFESIAARDPGCAMAHWGVAMTYYHPVWQPPTADDLKAGLAAVRKAKAVGPATERERSYVSALEAFFLHTEKEGAEPGAVAKGGAQSCHGDSGEGGRSALDHQRHALAYERAMERLHRQYPNDPEAVIFYALSLLETSSVADKTFTKQKKAGGMLGELFAKHPDHPGVAHYLIHSYDYPPLAARALGSARRYAKIAPWVPHALHMPSHIFTRLGLWLESIQSNLDSAAAARDHAAKRHPGFNSFEELHALDYLEYAYLQTVQDRKAREVAELAARIHKTFPEIDFIVAYALDAIPARYAVERRRWAEAAALAVPARPYRKAFPWTEAHLYFARGLGGARSGNLDAARQSVTRLSEIRDAIRDPMPRYWAGQVEIQRLSVAAWAAFAQGKKEEALALMREAAKLEASTEKHPVTPGAILPAHELLGDLLLELGQPAPSLDAYAESLRASPGRFYGIAGAARAAQRAGRPDAARKYYADLVALAANSDGARPEIAEARAFLAKGN